MSRPLVLCSASGSPGVTTAALALALSWPSSTVLVDADRTPAQAIQAGYFQGRSLSAGLGGLLRAQREGVPMVDALPSLLVPLIEARTPAQTRQFLPGFDQLGAVEQFASSWRALVETLATLDAQPVLDMGRVGLRGLPTPVAEASDVILLTRTSLAALAGVRLHVEVLRDQVVPGRLHLAAVGPGRPYTVREIASHFDLPVVGDLAWDPHTADAINSGGESGWERRPFGRSVARLGQALSRAIDGQRQESVDEL